MLSALERRIQNTAEQEARNAAEQQVHAHQLWSRMVTVMEMVRAILHILSIMLVGSDLGNSNEEVLAKCVIKPLSVKDNIHKGKHSKKNF